MMKDAPENLDGASDEALIKGFLSGRAEDFNTLYERYRRRLYSYVNRLVPGQHALSDDIFQQTWLKALDQLPKYKERQRFLSWLLRIAHNLAVDHFRREKGGDAEYTGQEDLDERLLQDSGEPWHEMDKEELGIALDHALAELSPDLREVFLLRQEDIAFKDIADIQGCTINTALSRMQYAMKGLQKRLGLWKSANMKGAEG